MKIETPWPRPDLSDCEFYHSFSLPDGEQIDGAWDLRGNFELYVGGVNFAAKSVLDIGTAGGFLAFGAEQAGARRVVALDLDCLASSDHVPFRGSAYMENKRDWSERCNEGLERNKRAFWYVWHALRSRVDVRYGSISELLSESDRFDIVMAGAILEHLADPVTALGVCCRLAKETVIVGFTPVYMSDEEFMRPLIPWENPANSYCWWALSRGLYDRVFRNMGFQAEYLPCSIMSDGVAVPRSTIVARRS